MGESLKEFNEQLLEPFIDDLNCIKRVINNSGPINIEIIKKIDILKKIISVYNDPDKIHDVINSVTNNSIPIALPFIDDEDDDDYYNSSDNSDNGYMHVADIFNRSNTSYVDDNIIDLSNNEEDEEDEEDKKGDESVEHLTVSSLEMLKYIREHRHYKIEEYSELSDDSDLENIEEETDNEYDNDSWESESVKSNKSESCDSNYEILIPDYNEDDNEMSEEIMSIYT